MKKDELKAAELEVVETDSKPEKQAEQEAPKAPPLRVHIVRKGDTLRNLAKQYLGDVRRMDEIRKKNELATDILHIGRELIIPDR